MVTTNFQDTLPTSFSVFIHSCLEYLIIHVWSISLFSFLSHLFLLFLQTPSIVRSHSLTENSFQSTCTVPVKTAAFAWVEDDWQSSIQDTRTVLHPRKHTSITQNCIADHGLEALVTDNFYAIDNELLAIFANADKPAALRRYDCLDPVSKLLEDKLFLPVCVITD